MYILVLVVLMINPDGSRENKRTEYLFYKEKDCQQMTKTIDVLTKGHPVYYKYRCEQVS
jgi:hypothetical protein